MKRVEKCSHGHNDGQQMRHLEDESLAAFWFLTNFKIGGKASTVEALTLQIQQPWIQFPPFPIFSEEKIVGVAEVYQRCCLEDSCLKMLIKPSGTGKWQASTKKIK